MKADTRTNDSTPTYSLVIPVHDEEEVLRELAVELATLRARLDGSSEIVFVDDGSTDRSWEILTEFADRDPTCVLVRLSRNFGHQIAVTAGLDHAGGDAVVVMDADLQDPPEVVVEMTRRWRDGYQVVYGVRNERHEDTWFKRTTADGFYRVMNRLSDVDIPSQVGDFRLIDRAVVDALARMPERNRYVRGMFAWLGFDQIGVEYSRPARAAGTTSYSVTNMLRLANDGVVGYSKLPIRFVTLVGAGLTCVGALRVIATATLAATRRDGGAGRSLPLRGVGVAGLQLVALGVVGEYVARIFDESIDRPLYVTSQVVRDDHATDDVMTDLEPGAGDNVRSILERNGAEIIETRRNGQLVESRR